MLKWQGAFSLVASHSIIKSQNPIYNMCSIRVGAGMGHKALTLCSKSFQLTLYGACHK